MVDAIQLNDVKIAAGIAASQCLGAVQLTALVAVAALIHFAQAGDEGKAILAQAQLADPTRGIGVEKLVRALLIVELPVQLVRGGLAGTAFAHLLILHFVGKQGAAAPDGAARGGNTSV